MNFEERMRQKIEKGMANERRIKEACVMRKSIKKTTILDRIKKFF